MDEPKFQSFLQHVKDQNQELNDFIKQESDQWTKSFDQSTTLLQTLYQDWQPTYNKLLKEKNKYLDTVQSNEENETFIGLIDSLEKDLDSTNKTIEQTIHAVIDLANQFVDDTNNTINKIENNQRQAFQDIIDYSYKQQLLLSVDNSNSYEFPFK